MEIRTFIQNYREAFGEAAELPILFWYSDEPVEPAEKINGCFFKGMNKVRAGNTLSLNMESIGCWGGKFYTGFIDMPEMVPQFVSVKEKYKKTPEMVVDFIQELGLTQTEKRFLNFARIDQVDDFEGIEGLFFLPTPDILAGLTTWAYYDRNEPDTVTSLFASGCCAVVSRAVVENRRDGKSTFIGFFDPSVRPFFEADRLSFMIPMSRFKEMYHTMRECSLFDTHAWGKLKTRINS